MCRHRRVRGRLALVFALSCAVAAVAAAPATAATPSPPLPSCAQTVSPDQLTVGQNLVGFTVRHGTTVESFNAKVLGIMTGGIDPGRDLVIVRTSGAPIAQAGGIWFGMSGSPVYTTGGKLVGAVSYGFSSTSTIAGLTPAEDMTALLNGGASPFAGGSSASPSPRHVRLSTAIRTRIARQPNAPADTGSMSQLEIPLSISGLTAQRREALRREAIKHHLPFFISAVGGSSVSGKGLSSTPMHPGDSFAAAESYGDITSAGVGTTSYVCNGQALAFGHPFFFSGPSELGAGGATAFGIVEDPVYGPYKLANVTEPTGIVQQDRLPGLEAQFGQAPPLVPITQHTAALDTGDERTGETDSVPNPKSFFGVPDIAATHSLADTDSVFDQISGGSSRVSLTAHGIRRPSGKPWTLSLGNRFVSSFDISYASASDVFQALEALDSQRLARIEFTGVDLGVDVERTVRELKIRNVVWSTNGRHYHHAHTLRLKAGHMLYAKVKMRASDTQRMRTTKLALRVPRHARGIAEVLVGSGGSGGGGLFECLFSNCGGGGKAKTFNALLKSLENAPRNDDLVATLSSRRSSSQALKHEPKVVKGHKLLLVKISSRHHHHRGRVRGIRTAHANP